ncbi:enoyl-CoA hydratase/isomerase family protein [Sagittula sp. NFXS13]|uniref:enoyl-CoA hydratase-related protein n=1 Tax=Sagittula sp. NFXS13 TaxID=2819095 RepID=UPI0032DFD083
MTPTSRTDADAVLFERDGPVAIITLNRPDQRNCINAAVANGLRDAVKRFEADPALRVAVLTGRGKVFCAGMDLKAFSDGAVDEVLFGQGRFAGFVSLERTKPIIAAVEGAALAGGLEIMLACDMAIASGSATFGLPEARLGLLAAAGGVFRLSARIPAVKARELVLTGRRFGAAEAEGYGLLNEVVEDGAALSAAMALAQSITESAPLAVRDGLLLSRLAECTAEAALWVQSDQLIERILVSADAQEGARAFREKRPPVWTGAE